MNYSYAISVLVPYPTGRPPPDAPATQTRLQVQPTSQILAISSTCSPRTSAVRPQPGTSAFAAQRRAVRVHVFDVGVLRRRGIRSAFAAGSSTHRKCASCPRTTRRPSASGMLMAHTTSQPATSRTTTPAPDSRLHIARCDVLRGGAGMRGHCAGLPDALVHPHLARNRAPRPCTPAHLSGVLYIPALATSSQLIRPRRRLSALPESRRCVRVATRLVCPRRPYRLALRRQGVTHGGRALDGVCGQHSTHASGTLHSPSRVRVVGSTCPPVKWRSMSRWRRPGPGWATVCSETISRTVASTGRVPTYSRARDGVSDLLVSRRCHVLVGGFHRASGCQVCENGRDEARHTYLPFPSL